MCNYLYGSQYYYNKLKLTCLFCFSLKFQSFNFSWWLLDYIIISTLMLRETECSAPLRNSTRQWLNSMSTINCRSSRSLHRNLWMAIAWETSCCIAFHCSYSSSVFKTFHDYNTSHRRWMLRSKSRWIMKTRWPETSNTWTAFANKYFLIFM